VPNSLNFRQKEALKTDSGLREVLRRNYHELGKSEDTDKQPWTSDVPIVELPACPRRLLDHLKLH